MLIRSSKQKAFTLIELMAAVAVFAISATGLYSINQQSVFVADRLESKTFAQWVALNAFNELELEKELPSIGSDSGDKEFAGVKWKVITDVSDTALKSVRRVHILVKNEQDQQLASIDGFVGLRTPVSLENY